MAPSMTKVAPGLLQCPKHPSLEPRLSNYKRVNNSKKKLDFRRFTKIFSHKTELKETARNLEKPCSFQCLIVSGGAFSPALTVLAHFGEAATLLSVSIFVVLISSIFTKSLAEEDRVSFYT